MGVNILLKTVTRQRRDCDLNPGPSAPESSTLTTRLPSIKHGYVVTHNQFPVLSAHAGLTVRDTETETVQSRFSIVVSGLLDIYEYVLRVLDNNSNAI